MQFYMCKPNGAPPQLAATQTDAKALDKGFELIELRDDKAGRIEYINALLSQAYAPGVPMSALAALDTAGQAASVVLELERTYEPEPPKATAHPAPAARATKGVPLSDLTLTQIDEIMARTSMEEAIWAMDAAGLDKLMPVIEERRAELAKKALQPVAPEPAPRKRIRPA